MKVLLINPNSSFDLYKEVGGNLPPMGLAYLASVLQNQGHTVTIRDLEVEPSDNLEFDQYDLLGIGSLTPQFNNAIKVAREAKKENLPVVMGSYHPTFMDQEALETGVVDYIVRGEGEYIMEDLVNTLEQAGKPEDVKGVSYMKNGSVIRTPAAPFIRDLDNLPLPARDLLPLDKYDITIENHKAASVISSRGCPFNCSFCSSSIFGGLKWRSRSPESLTEEIKHLKQQYGYQAFYFMDDNFTLRPGRVIRFADNIIREIEEATG